MTIAMTNVVSLYDESGNMLRPWAEAGYQCYCFDILNDGRTEIVGTRGGMIYYMQGDMLDIATVAYVIRLKPVFIASFPPCTDVAVCGALHFAKKRAIDPLFQTKAVQLFRIPEMIANVVGCSWFSENPASMISTLWRKPDHKFHPWQYGGYLPVDDVHPRWPDYLPPRDAYPKYTWIWSGNSFIMPTKQEVTDVHDDYPGWKKLGGKSAKTKQIRSETPRGFARAVYEANAI